ncbi:MAG: trypsin-like peptidase domain-containing protein [Hyphomicrobiaceae bacterium]
MNSSKAFATIGLGLLVCTLAASPGETAMVLPGAQGIVKLPDRLVRPIAIFGKDERVRVPRKYQTVSDGIGLIHDISRNIGCTAFCVGADVIATNAHCIVRTPGRRRKADLSKVYFLLLPKSARKGRRDSGLVFVAKDQPLLSIYADYYRGGGSVVSFTKDWAFAKLSHSVCRGHELEFASPSQKDVNKAAKRGSLFLIGYHGDKSVEDKWLSPACGIRSTSSRRYFLSSQRRALKSRGTVLPHTCDTKKGSSGAPVLMQTASGPRVIAINAGTTGYALYRRVRGSRRKRNVYTRSSNVAVLTSAFIRGLERFKAEHLLTDLDDLTRLQTVLKASGHYKASVDGVFGRGTRGAILKFEKENGLAPLGMPTRELLERIEASYNKPGD